MWIILENKKECVGQSDHIPNGILVLLGLFVDQFKY